MTKPVVPAIIPRSADDVHTTLKKLSFSHEIHLDVVDGNFVPFRSWPYDPEGSPNEVRSSTDAFTLEVDLMVSDPVPAAHAWIKAGADMLVFHVETITLEAFINFSARSKISIGVSANNDTPLQTLLQYAHAADYVQLMGIGQIGAQGQPFDERVIERITQIKKQVPNLPVTVDGSVNAETIASISRSGADRFICGSAIVQAESPHEAQRKLQALTSCN